MCYDLPCSRCEEQLLLHHVETLFIAKGRVCFLSIFIKSVYCLVKAIQFYIQHLDLMKLQLAENKHGHIWIILKR